jgi:hypothetical protein
MTEHPMSLNGYNYVESNPVNGAVGELIFHNRYSYANNNPVNLVDPDGMQACIPGFTCTAPSADDIFIPDVGDGFRTIIIPPNLGVFGAEYSWELAMQCNIGFCGLDVEEIMAILSEGEDENDPPIIIIPDLGEVIDETAIAQRRRCSRERQQELQARVNRYCKGPQFHCNENDSCRTLRRKFHRADRCA